VLQVFGQASGLFANLDKSVATPIHCTDAEIQLVQEALSCRIEGFPCRYLGVPLSIFRLRKIEEQGLIDAVAARIPRWKGSLLNVVGRTTLVQVILSAMPVHMAIASCLSSWAIDCIDKLRRGFIWAGADSVSGGRCKVAWPVVCRPRDLGGLGVADLRRAGVALRLRWPWLQRVEPERAWTSLPDKDDRQVTAVFQAATASTLGNGETTLF
jgi:hypothetical protein